MKELKTCPFCGGEAISGLKWTEQDVFGIEQNAGQKRKWCLLMLAQ